MKGAVAESMDRKLNARQQRSLALSFCYRLHVVDHYQPTQRAFGQIMRYGLVLPILGDTELGGLMKHKGRSNVKNRALAEKTDKIWLASRGDGRDPQHESPQNITNIYRNLHYDQTSDTTSSVSNSTLWPTCGTSNTTTAVNITNTTHSHSSAQTQGRFLQ